MRKRMNVMYLNANMEGVRQIALRNFKEIYQEIFEDLKGLGVEFSSKSLIEKYEELTK